MTKSSILGVHFFHVDSYVYFFVIFVFIGIVFLLYFYIALI